MTAKGLEAGTVFHYPYLWGHAARKGSENPKDRTVCVAMRRQDNLGNTHLVILPISAQAPKNASAAIVVSEFEKKRAGLDPARSAFVHIDDYNVDVLNRSTYYNPNARP